MLKAGAIPASTAPNPLRPCSHSVHAESWKVMAKEPMSLVASSESYSSRESPGATGQSVCWAENRIRRQGISEAGGKGVGKLPGFQAAGAGCSEGAVSGGNSGKGLDTECIWKMDFTAFPKD